MLLPGAWDVVPTSISAMRPQTALWVFLVAGLAAGSRPMGTTGTKEASLPPSGGLKELPVSSPPNSTVRFKEQLICETTPGVKSYSGFIDLGSDSHTFFWFFEARHNATTAPITLWLNGGPGYDSLQGLFAGRLFAWLNTTIDMFDEARWS